MPAMSVRQFAHTAPKVCESFLPFLYQTRTIQGRCIRHLSSNRDAALVEPSVERIAKEQDSTVYKPASHAGQSAQNNELDITRDSSTAVQTGDAGGDGFSGHKSSGRRRILYPSLMQPHERTEAAKRLRARQAVDELNDALSFDTLPSDRNIDESSNDGSSRGWSGAKNRLGGFTRRRKTTADAIPFEKGTITKGSSAEELSTITPSERKVFEKLFKAGAVSVPKSEPPKASEETAEGETKAPRHRSSSRIERPAPQFPRELESMAKVAQRSVTLPSPTTPNGVGKTADGVRLSYSALHAQGRASNSIAKLTKRLQVAETDYQCWRIFTNRLDQYLGMLSPSNPADQQYMARLVADILPAVLVSCAKTLRDRFPGSTLALGVLPALKRAGPRAYAIGCSTALYNTHMSILYNQYTDISAVIDVLQEMDREVYLFDDETHSILDKILYDARGVKEGVMEKLSPAIVMLWSTERMQRAVRDVEKWRDIVEERRQNEALRLARQKDELEEAVENEGANQAWLLKEGEYLSSQPNAGRNANIEDDDEHHTKRRGREMEIQEKVDALMPDGWKGLHEKKSRKTRKLPVTRSTKRKKIPKQERSEDVQESSHNDSEVSLTTTNAS